MGTTDQPIGRQNKKCYIYNVCAKPKAYFLSVKLQGEWLFQPLTKIKNNEKIKLYFTIYAFFDL
jgi:hypothetical protein